jgi:nitroreductase
MIKGSEIRKADHPIEKLLIDRWSPRAMSGEEISHEELMRLFEAARWAPSSFNTQQWRALYARRGTEHWQTFFDLLVDANKTWAKNAAVLVVFISRKLFDHDNEPSVTHSYDCGAAWENLALQGFQQGLGRARDARIRLRSRAERTSDSGRVPSRSDGRSWQAGSERIAS